MTAHQPPRLALTLLEYFVPDSAPLAGDLVEDFERRPSRRWFWWQVIGAIATGLIEHSEEIRPLRLVDLQPADAVARTRKASIRFAPVNITASPVDGVGGLGLVMLALLLTTTLPSAWLAFAAAILAGVFLSIVFIFLHRPDADSDSRAKRIRTIVIVAVLAGLGRTWSDGAGPCRGFRSLKEAHSD